MEMTFSPRLTPSETVNGLNRRENDCVPQTLAQITTE